LRIAVSKAHWAFSLGLNFVLVLVLVLVIVIVIVIFLGRFLSPKGIPVSSRRF